MLSAVTVGRSGVDKLETAQGEQHFHALLFSSRLKTWQEFRFNYYVFQIVLVRFIFARASPLS